jgi:hypothetical protein
MEAEKIRKEYNEMLKLVKNRLGEVKENRVNCYFCKKCGHITKTVDIDAGVTPFMHECEKCGELAISSFYKDIAPNSSPTQEWYRPTLEESLKIKSDGLLRHIFSGGLNIRKIKL